MSAPHQNTPKRLERSTNDKFLAGVCGGVAHYLNMDPTLVRVLWVIATIALGGAPLIVYLVMLFVVPEESSTPGYPPSVNGPEGQPGWSPYPQGQQSAYPPAPQPGGAPGPAPQPPQSAGAAPADQAVWGQSGAPWEQPEAVRTDEGSTDGSTSDTSEADTSKAGTSEAETSKADTSEAGPSAPEGDEAAGETAADHNEPSRGGQPMS